SEWRLLSKEEKILITGGACSSCSGPSWQGPDQVLGSGSGECEHGPEHDTDCIADSNNACYHRDCSEYDPNTCRNANCSCYACNTQGATGCEELKEYYMATCGLTDDKDEACASQCTQHGSGTTGPVIRSRPQTVAGGGSCSASTGVQSKYKCGKP